MLSISVSLSIPLSFLITLHAYPLDGVEHSGIKRLIGYNNAQLRQGGAKLPIGALLGMEDIKLTLESHSSIPDFDEQPQDPALQTALESILKTRDPSYGAVLVDMSNPDAIVWASVRPDIRQNPGSVGKLLVMIGLFDALARAFPDTDERARILRETLVTGGNWVIKDHHDIPHFNENTGFNSFSKVVPQDTFTLSEWIDHMISPSANAAASVVWRETMLLRHFGQQYPVSQKTAEQFFTQTPKLELTALSQQVINEPLEQAAIDTAVMQQGSFFTGYGKQRIPGIKSYATPRELARVLFRIEQGRMVDAWSSLEMKRYMYITKRRYRYVYAPELHEAAAYFKSGSFYQCVPEEGFQCGKYMGNKTNLMNSVAIIEWHVPDNTGSRYIISLMSNVLKHNSAWDHSRIAVAIDEIVKSKEAQRIKDEGSEQDIQGSGRS